MAGQNLVIRRKVEQSFLIGGNVRVTFLAWRNGEAILAIEAPREIPVNRSEVAQRITDSGRRLPVLVCEPLMA
jgi:carbon storage regulator CsrA